MVAIHTFGKMLNVSSPYSVRCQPHDRAVGALSRVSNACRLIRRRVTRITMLATMLLVPALSGCREKWTAHEHPERDAELEADIGGQVLPWGYLAATHAPLSRDIA